MSAPAKKMPPKGAPPGKKGPPPAGGPKKAAGGKGAPTANYRARVEAILNKYDPAKVGTVDQMMTKFAGNEPQLINALVKRYGPEPPAAAATGSSAAKSAPPAASGAGKKGPAAATTAPSKGKQPPGKAAVPPGGAAAKQKAPPTAAEAPKKGPPPASTKAPPGGSTASPTTKGKTSAPPAATGDPSTREILTVFYEKHAPDKIGTMDEILKVFSGREEKLYSSMEQRYSCPGEIENIRSSLKEKKAGQAGKAPPPASSAPGKKAPPASGGATGTAASGGKKAPPAGPTSSTGGKKAPPTGAPASTGSKKMPSSAAAAPSASSATVAPTPEQQTRNLLTAFYNDYAPDKLNSIDEIMKAFKGRDEQMFTGLEDRYKCRGAVAELRKQGAHLKTHTPKPVSEEKKAEDQQRQQARTRLVAVLEKYQPEKVPKADEMLNQFKGRENEMVDTMERKFKEKEEKEEKERQDAQEQQERTQREAEEARKEADAQAAAEREAAKQAAQERLAEQERKEKEEQLKAEEEEAMRRRQEQEEEQRRNRLAEEEDALARKKREEAEALSPATAQPPSQPSLPPLSPSPSSPPTSQPVAASQPPSLQALHQTYPWTNKSLPLQARLEHFYARYNPAEKDTKVAVALNMVQKGKCTENEMLVKLYTKYELGPDGLPRVGAAAATANAGPTSPHSAVNVPLEKRDALIRQPSMAQGYHHQQHDAVQPGDEAGEPLGKWTDASLPLKARLIAFYERYNPTQMSKVDAAMRMVERGETTEDQLFLRLFEKYDLNPVTGMPKKKPMQAVAVFTPKERLTALCHRYCPDKLSMTDEVLKMYEGREETLFENLHRQYNIQSEEEYLPKKQGSLDTTRPPTTEDPCPRATDLARHYGLAPHYVKYLFQHHNGNENAVMFDLLCTVFPDSVMNILADEDQALGFVARRLSQFYSYHNPRHVPEIPRILKKYDGKSPMAPLGDVLIRYYGDVLQSADLPQFKWSTVLADQSPPSQPQSPRDVPSGSPSPPPVPPVSGDTQALLNQMKHSCFKWGAEFADGRSAPKKSATTSTTDGAINLAKDMLNATTTTEDLLKLVDQAVETTQRESNRNQVSVATMTDDNRMGPAYRPPVKSPIQTHKSISQLQRERYVDMYGQEPSMNSSSSQHLNRVHYSTMASGGANVQDDPTVDPYAQAIQGSEMSSRRDRDVFNGAAQFEEYSPVPPNRSDSGVNRSLDLGDAHEFSSPPLAALPSVSAWLPPQPCSRCDDLSKQLETATEKMHKMRVNFELRERKRVMDELAGISTNAVKPSCSGCEELRHQVHVLSKKLHTLRTQRQDYKSSQESYKNLVNLTSQYPMFNENDGGGECGQMGLVLPHSSKQEAGTMSDITFSHMNDMEGDRLLEQL